MTMIVFVSNNPLSRVVFTAEIETLLTLTARRQPKRHEIESNTGQNSRQHTACLPLDLKAFSLDSHSRTVTPCTNQKVCATMRLYNAECKRELNQEKKK